MKVIQINAFYEYSSTGRTTREMHEYLKSKGIDSYVFCANMEIKGENVFQIGNKLDHKIHAFFSRLFGLQGYFSFSPTRRLLKNLLTIQPDVVILRNLHSNYINIPQLLRFLGEHDISSIVVLHDCFFYTGHCCYYTYDKCLKWEKECNSCPILYKYNSSLFFDRSRKIFRDRRKLFGSINNLAVVGVSDWVTNEAKRAPIFAGAKIIRRIYNWIDLDVFQPLDDDEYRAKYNINRNDFVVLGVAQRWNDVKGLPQFIELAQHMPNIKVVLVGDIEPQDLPHNIIKVGVKSDTTELTRFYSMADVFVNFSIQETFGKVAAEALSCGTPIIVNRSTANPELCGEGCGLIVENRDWKEVMECVKEVMKNGKALYTRRCRDYAVENFEKVKGIQQYMGLFNDLLM